MSRMFKYCFALFSFLFLISGSAFAYDSSFTGTDATSTVSQALVAAGVSSDLKVKINEVRDEDVVARSNHPITAQLDSLELNKEHTRWKGVLLFTSNYKNLPPLAVSGTYDEFVEIPVLKNRFRSGEVIGQEDIDFIKQPAKFVRKNTITDVKELIGKSPKNIISQNRPVRQEEVTAPAILMKGTRVTLMFKSRNLEIRTLGEAMDSGAKGDVIRVRNTASKSIVSGTVQSENMVIITSPDSHSAEAM